MAINRRILAIGGGGFMMEGKFSPIDRELLRLTGKPRPRVCLIPTPTGDAEELLQRFYSAYDPWCDACKLTPFRKMTDRSVPLRDIATASFDFSSFLVKKRVFMGMLRTLMVKPGSGFSRKWF